MSIPFIEPSYFNCTTNDSDDFNDVRNCDTIIGYSYNSSVPIVFLIFGLAGFILNFILIIDFCRKKNSNSSRKQSSMKKLFVILPILDSITSIYWIISCSFFWNAQRIRDWSLLCSGLSLTYLSVFTFEFIFINFILIHFRKISLNPIEGILKPQKNILKYLISSIVFTLIVLAISLFMKIIGRSPMITCFINTEESEKNGFIFYIPEITMISTIIQVVYDLCCRDMFVTDKEVRQAYKINISYVLVFTLLHIPLLVLISISAGNSNIINDNDKILVNYTFFCTALTCSIPMIIGLIRNLKGFTKLKKIQQLQRKLTRTANKRNMEGFNHDYENPLNNDTSIYEDQFDWLEKHSMEFFMRDILLGIAVCINKSKEYTKNGQTIKPDLQSNENLDILKHHITIDNFPLKERDKNVAESRYLNINISEYAPKIFAYLRNLEDIDPDEMIESFLPKNNKQGISESQGKSGSFFISTDDNYYMVKTLRSDEFDLIRHTFLKEYVQYLTHNPNSLLCRIYCMYNITLSQGDEMLIIVMRNVLGDFKDNIIAKYDLKGSTANRKSNFDMDKSDSSTMKDLNFNEYEHGIMISRDNIKKFRKMTKNDSGFLCKLDLMDYSVFLVKLTLSKSEQIDIFGEGIRQKQDKDFNDLLVNESLKPSVMTDAGGDILRNDYQDNNLKISDTINSIRGLGKIYNLKHYKQYLYPSLNPGNAYILAIIDYFQMFNFYKYVESGLKTKFAKDAEGVSCVDPKTYSKRFIKYFIKLTDIRQFYKDNHNIDKSNLNYIDKEFEYDEDNENLEDSSERIIDDSTDSNIDSNNIESNIELKTFKFNE